MDGGRLGDYWRKQQKESSRELTQDELKMALDDEDFAKRKAESIKQSMESEDLERFEFACSVCDEADLTNVYMAADAMGIQPSSEIKTIMKASVMAGAARMMAVLGDGVDQGFLRLVMDEYKKREDGKD